MDYARLAVELADKKYSGLSTAEIVAVLVEKNVPTEAGFLITPSELFGRFTPGEARAIADASETDATVFWFYRQLELAQGKIDLADNRIVQGLGLLAQRGLILQERIPDLTAAVPGPPASRAELIGCDTLLAMDARSVDLAIAQARSIKQ